MSEEKKEQQTTEGVKLDGLYAFKMGMSTIYEDGVAIPVTALKYEPMVVAQVKSQDKEGYEAVQVAFKPRRAKRSTEAQKKHLKGSRLENGAFFVREIRQALPEGVQKGQLVSIESLQKGDLVTLTAKSKGRGFQGVMKRHNFAGGPAAHGSGFHRRPGSVGNRTWPARVMPGRKLPGHFGDEVITSKNVKICEVFPEDNVILVRGPVPGGSETLVRLSKM